ncbi:MAG: apolipoprotein N-acyltransferase [Bauldia sp.]
MTRLADSVILLWGWRRWLLALIAGAITALALAPFDLVPIAFLTIPIFVWLIDGSVPPEGSGILRRVRPAAAVGWWFGFGYFVSGLWWLGPSFLVDGDEFAFLLPFGVVGLPAVLAILWALGAVVARLLWCDGWSRVLVFAIVMTIVEWLRGHIFTGFPWNAFGYALMPTPAFMQAASLVGVWGITLLAFLVFAAPVLLARSHDGSRGRLVAFAAIAILLLADIAFGLARLRSADGAVVPDVRLRLVQASIPQAVKNDPSQRGTMLQRQIDLSRSPGIGAITHVIWPETAVPYILTEEPEALAALGGMLDPGAVLIAGAPRAADPQEGRRGPVTNSVLVIDDNGVILDAYDKVHLVPFGEYLPMRDLLESIGIREIIPLPGGFAAGAERRSLVAGNAPPFVPLICYEIIFPAEIMPPGERPAFILNVTNDAWYGDTPGPRQHFRQSIVRAVEEGLPLVRSANNGISAIVDAYGQVSASLGLNEVGVVDGELPASLPATVYSRLGDAVPGVLVAVLALIAAVGRIATASREN